MGYVLKVHVPSRQVFRISTLVTVAQVVRSIVSHNTAALRLFRCFAVSGLGFKVFGLGLRVQGLEPEECVPEAHVLRGFEGSIP